MKNKKLFAILTLVCFMMTLMPVAAFAATTDYVKAGDVTFTVTATGDVDVKPAAGRYLIVVPAEKATANGTVTEVLAVDTAKTIAASAVAADANYYLSSAVNVAVEGTDDTWADAVAMPAAVKATSAEVTTFLADPAYAGYTVGGATANTYTAFGDKYLALSAAATTAVAADTKVVGFLATSKVLDAFNAYVADPTNETKLAAFQMLNETDADFVTLVDAVYAPKTPSAIMTSLESAVNAARAAAILEAAGIVALEDEEEEQAPNTPQAGANAADKGTSAVFTVKNNPTVKIDDAVKVALELRDAADKYAKDEVAYIWFTEAGSTLPSTGVVLGAGLADAAPSPVVPGLFVTNGAAAVFNGEVKVSFQRAGEYTLHAATLADFTYADGATTTVAEFMAELTKAEMKTVSTNKVVTVKGENVNSADYALVAEVAGKTQTVTDGGTFAGTVGVAADGLAKTALEFTLYESDAVANVVKGETVKIETSSSNIEVSKEEATTNALGKFSFAVSGVREGNYEIYLECGSYEATIKVAVGATAPTNIVVAKAPTAPVNIDATADLSDIVRFVITDINGNTLTSDQAKNAGEKAFTITDDGIYASIVSAPAGSDLTDEDVVLVKDTANSNLATGIYSTLAITGGLDVEGTYEFKVALNNGKSVYVTVEAKEFGTPVGIVLEYSAPSVELGGVMNTKDFLLVDKNGVTTKANGKVELAASGYAIANFDTTNGTITVKADEKYLGSTITVTAVSERYDLMTSASVKVVAEAAGLMFATKTAEVDVNNAIQVVLVDAQGNRTAFGDARADRTNYDINYVVLDKPEGAKVAVNTAAVDNNLLAAGSFKMNLTCNKVGTVKVQAVAKITKVAADGKDVVKYYTGVGEIAVGTGETGKSVVMSIGSNEMIADGKVSTVDAQPMIQNNRTFVPFRALAEAFGATVAYDQATSAVTATLNGVEVVMTVGSPVYTVNGVEKTADVAPFISDSRTFVPVRFAAEAFGITVTPTYNADGSVADVLFNM